jgi:hypothetical protein
MNFTKRNHYNPCFWTALWNPEYFRRAQRGLPLPTPRKQIVCALSIKSGQCRDAPTERVHYDKGLGVAEITREHAHAFAKRYHPDRYAEFAQDDQGPYPVYLDFEDILTGLEKLPPYQVALKIAASGEISTHEEKSFLAAFVMLQRLRSHAVMQSMIEMHAELDQPKFEHFVTLKWMLSDQGFLADMIFPLALGKWFLYSADKMTFPLCDSSVLVLPDSIMVPLSPHFLLEIHQTAHDEDAGFPPPETISSEKYEEFRRRTIGNTFREIIGDREVLGAWQKSPEFIARIDQMKDIKTYNVLVSKESEKELWHINAFGNRN